MSGSATYSDRLRIAEEYALENPFLAMSPIGEPRPEVLKGDVVFNGEYCVVPFGGDGESGWAAWFFRSQALQAAFIRRYKNARPMKSLSQITRRS